MFEIPTPLNNDEADSLHNVFSEGTLFNYSILGFRLYIIGVNAYNHATFQHRMQAHRPIYFSRYLYNDLVCYVNYVENWSSPSVLYTNDACIHVSLYVPLLLLSGKIVNKSGLLSYLSGMS
jgi:hypothetical protein